MDGIFLDSSLGGDARSGIGTCVIVEIAEYLGLMPELKYESTRIRGGSHVQHFLGTNEVINSDESVYLDLDFTFEKTDGTKAVTNIVTVRMPAGEPSWLNF